MYVYTCSWMAQVLTCVEVRGFLSYSSTYVFDRIFHWTWSLLIQLVSASAETPGTAQLQRHLLQEDLIEDCLRNQGLLTQTIPANQELLFRRAAFLGPMGCGWRVLKELAALILDISPLTPGQQSTAPESPPQSAGITGHVTHTFYISAGNRNLGLHAYPTSTFLTTRTFPQSSRPKSLSTRATNWGSRILMPETMTFTEKFFKIFSNVNFTAQNHNVSYLLLSCIVLVLFWFDLVWIWNRVFLYSLTPNAWPSYLSLPSNDVIGLICSPLTILVFTP
jgi:hypothetical protein